MANQSVRLKEEQLRREEEKLREIEFKVQRELQVRKQELMAKEDSLRVLEQRLGELWSGDSQCNEGPAHSNSPGNTAAQHTGGTMS